MKAWSIIGADAENSRSTGFSRLIIRFLYTICMTIANRKRKGQIPNDLALPTKITHSAPKAEASQCTQLLFWQAAGIDG